MTINQNTTKINTIKNTTLPELLQKINSLPDAGSGGGSGVVETCTVNVSLTGSSGDIQSIIYIDETGYKFDWVNARSYTFNSVCDSIIIVGVSGSAIYFQDLTNADYFYNTEDVNLIVDINVRAYKITASKDETATIILELD